MNTVFTEFLPSHTLLPYIQTYWQGNFNIKGEKDFSQSVLPNGCIELIIHITDNHCTLSKNDGDWAKSPVFTLLGLYDKPYEVQFSHNVRVFGIRFYPDGIRNIFGIPPSEFLATYEDGTDVFGHSLREFCAKIRELNTTAEQVSLANEFISGQLASHVQTYDYTHLAMKLIRKVQGMADYQELTAQVPISIRQLQREFKALYGITVRDYMRLSRMNAIHNYMLSKNQSLTQLPYDLNFSDQSHFIREFKNYVGVAPKKFINRRNQFIINPAIRHYDEKG
jgi:AraC-like DNA-binding protein